MAESAGPTKTNRPTQQQTNTQINNNVYNFPLAPHVPIFSHAGRSAPGELEGIRDGPSRHLHDGMGLTQAVT
eukprot:6379831-Karenia_brevis.AAC.1